MAAALFSVDENGQPVQDTWNQKVPMPARLAERVDNLQKRFATSPTEMNQKEANAALRQKENVENIRAKAQKATVKGNQARERRTEFGENMHFMGNTMGNTEAPVKLPKSLQSRVQALAPAPVTSSALKAKQAKASQNREAALAAKRAAAKTSSARAAAAQERKHAAVRKSQEAVGLFEVDVGAEETQAAGGWGRKVPLPPRLQQRVKKMQERFSYDVNERFDRTAANHAQSVDAIRARAHQTSERVEAARQRRALAAGDEFHFTVTADPADADADLAKAQGWTAQTPALPARLQQRLTTLKQQFPAKDTFAEQARAAANRTAFHEGVAAKGRAEGSEKIAAAQSRRALAVGDATHFTVQQAKFSAEDDDNAVEAVNGWGVQKRAKLPSRLAARLAEIEAAKARTDPAA